MKFYRDIDIASYSPEVIKRKIAQNEIIFHSILLCVSSKSVFLGHAYPYNRLTSTNVCLLKGSKSTNPFGQGRLP